MTIGKDIIQSLNDAIEYERGNKTRGRSTIYFVEPVPEFEADEIKQIRNRAGMTQTLFAGALGVSKKAVEAWEAGTKRPNGSARRMIGMLKENPSCFESFARMK